MAGGCSLHPAWAPVSCGPGGLPRSVSRGLGLPGHCHGKGRPLCVACPSTTGVPHAPVETGKHGPSPQPPPPCARLPCGSPAATVRVRVRLAPGCAPRSRAVTCALVALVWRRDHVLDYQVSPPRCMPLLAFREAWPTVSAGLLSVSAPAPPAGDAAAHQAVRSPGHSLPLPPRPGVSPEAPGQHLRPREPQHPPSPGASPPPKGWTHVTFLFLSGMFQAEATPTPCPSSPLSVGL